MKIKAFFAMLELFFATVLGATIGCFFCGFHFLPFALSISTLFTLYALMFLLLNLFKGNRS